MDAGIFNTAKISVNQKTMHLTQMLFLDRWISHTTVFIVALFSMGMND